VQLRTQFHAVVNGENGDTFLQRVAATFWKTTVWSEGSVAGGSGEPGKTASVELAAKDGRIQDVLLLFAQSERAPMSGTVSFHAKVSIPPGKRPFLEKVELQGDFGIDAGSFTKFDTQQGVNRLSEGALGEEDRHKAEKDEDKDKDGSDTVLSDLKGHVRLRDGTARFSDLSFSVPGALAQMQGTYNLLTEKIDLRGTLRTDSEPSNTTHGVKALMLKVLEPFFKKKRAGYIMPVKITGTYGHPSFGLDLTDRDDKKPQKQNTNSSQSPGEASR
jgi:AsmA-like protein